MLLCCALLCFGGCVLLAPGHRCVKRGMPAADQLDSSALPVATSRPTLQTGLEREVAPDSPDESPAQPHPFLPPAQPSALQMTSPVPPRPAPSP